MTDLGPGYYCAEARCRRRHAAVCPRCESEHVTWQELNWSILHPFSTGLALICNGCGWWLRTVYR